ncbi:hypothetical protein NAEGRDRAFT_81882 [Naegleria gruberi]|uniref:Uncharacterized protein n=1 Tax=Naegleria gruberi TaxID=5762 RepID=D2VZY5_NAEGR|nr:uncharacterized protein NAEGRDRAFT_81882 [Naegleria gruberi]EFC37649.1 hypothetical protein NAEGRDRAFT_81882 [Naegleria gruberi]|eukprot:XP_002670393.1 hypothetical protein NAEGRDRAFT_81882 [Naegleria gruberi strain NEG-M]
MTTLLYAGIAVLVGGGYYLLFSNKKENNQLDDDECMTEGTDEEIIVNNDLIQQKKTNTRMFLFPSLFTDHRIFSNQKKVYGDILQVIDLFELDEKVYGKVDELTLHSYAKQLTAYIVKNYEKEILDKDFEQFFVGGFCVGGMISIFVAQELMKGYPEIAKKLKGVMLVGSCPSFTHCVDPRYLKIKKVVMNYFPRFVLNGIVRFYLWANRYLNKISSLMESNMVSVWKEDRNIMLKYKTVLDDMMLDKDPNFVFQMLIAEFNFTAHDLDNTLKKDEQVEWDRFNNDLPISHLHGDNDYLLRSNLCESFVKQQVLPNKGNYRLRVMKHSGHFLPLTRMNAVTNFIYNIIQGSPVL